MTDATDDLNNADKAQTGPKATILKVEDGKATVEATNGRIIVVQKVGALDYHRLTKALAKLGDILLAAQVLQYDADLLFRRILPARLTPNVLQHLFSRGFTRPGFLFPLRSLRLR
jgi:hypothetical protein